MSITTHRLNGVNGKPQSLPDDPDIYFDERAELGAAACAMIDPSCISMLPAPHEFHGPAGRLLKIIGDIVRQGGKPESLAAEVIAAGQNDPDIGAGYLADVARAEATAANAPIFAKAISNKALQRKSANILSAGLLAVDQGKDPLEVLRSIQADHEDMMREAGAEPARPVPFSDMVADYPHLREEIVPGICRRGEIVNIVSSSKVGKSWLAHGLLFHLVMGMVWLGRFACTQTRVLLVDNELHPETLTYRLKKIAKAMGLELAVVAGLFDVLHLRGRLVDWNGMDALLRDTPPGTYGAVIFDAGYRFDEQGGDENSNSQKTQVYNLLDGFAARMDAACFIVAHATKGSQSEKQITDVGAGAGAQSRATDTHLVIRAHEEEGAAVLEGVVRSFAPIEPVVLRFDFPLWVTVDNLDPKRLKGLRGPREERQREADVSDSEKIVAALKDGPMSETKIRAHIGAGRDRTLKLLTALVNENRIQSGKKKVNGGKARMYRLPKVTE